MYFRDRKDAGLQLASALSQYKNRANTIVVGLARGGIVVAKEIAITLHLPLDILIARKIGSPQSEELAIGAIAGTSVWLDQDIISLVGASPDYIHHTIAKEKTESERRLQLYRKDKPPQSFQHQTILLVDDGIATGATARASILWLKKCKAKAIILAVPVAAPSTLKNLEKEVDAIFCLLTPTSFMAVGQFYEHFPQVTDIEVVEELSSPHLDGG